MVQTLYLMMIQDQDLDCTLKSCNSNNARPCKMCVKLELILLARDIKTELMKMLCNLKSHSCWQFTIAVFLAFAKTNNKKKKKKKSLAF